MRNPFGPLTLAALLALLHVAAPSGHAAAPRAQDTPSWNKTSKGKPKPAPPRPRPAQRRQPSASPLEIEYRVFKVNENNSQVEVNSVTVFNRGDRVRLAVKANADLYLFVIHQKSPHEGGRIFVPDSRISNGQNFLFQGREFIFPDANCQPGAAALCSYLVDGAAGQEYFTLIFSRGPNLRLLDGAAATGGVVSAQAIADFVNHSGQRLDTSGRGGSIFARSVRSLNQKDDTLAVRFMLNKRG